MIGIRQLKPIHRLVAIVTGVCSRCQTHLCSGASKLLHALDFSNDDIWSWHKSRCICAGYASHGRHYHRFGNAVNQLRDLDWLHRGAG